MTAYTPHRSYYKPMPKKRRLRTILRVLIWAAALFIKELIA